jgi:hypothetical protein
LLKKLVSKKKTLTLLASVDRPERPHCLFHQPHLFLAFSVFSKPWALMLLLLLFSGVVWAQQDCGSQVVCPALLPCVSTFNVTPARTVCAGSVVQAQVASFSAPNVSAPCACGCGVGFDLLVSWYSTFDQLLGSYLVTPTSCAGGVYSFFFSPSVPALHRLDVRYGGVPVQNNVTCPCPPPPDCACLGSHISTGLVAADCNHCDAPDAPCRPAVTPQYDTANNVPGGNQIVFDFSNPRK